MGDESGTEFTGSIHSGFGLRARVIVRIRIKVKVEGQSLNKHLDLSGLLSS